MVVNLSVKQVPEALARRLRRRAAQHHRSLQGELLAILHEAVEGADTDPTDRRASAASRASEPAATYAARSDWEIAPRSESALMIRADRDGRTFTAADLLEYVKALGSSTPAESTAWIRHDRSSK